MIKFLTEKKNSNFMRLWSAQLISQFGDRIHQLALVGLIAERKGVSATSLAKLLAFTILPVFIIQPIAGVFVDRWDRRTTLFVCDLARGLLVLSIPLVFMHFDAMLPIYIVVFLAFCFSRFYVPAKMSIIPDIVEQESLITANSMVTSTGMIAFVMGCALGGVLVEGLGSRAGFIIDALSFFLSGGIVYSIATKKPLKIDKDVILKKGKDLVGEIKQSVWAEFKEGFAYLFKNKEIRFIASMLFVLLAAAGAIYVVIIVFIQHSFNSTTKHLGVLAVSLGVGLFLGVILYGRWGKKSSWQKTIFFCLVAGGIMLILFSIIVKAYPNIWIAMLLACFLGMIVGPIFIVSNTMVHVVSDDRMRGKVFSFLEIVIHFAFLTTMLISSWLAKYVSEQSILITTGLVFAFIGTIGYLRFTNPLFRGRVPN
ncbi:MAG: MFS transporter [Candidatus Omnitrophica bacterium]|nr:MFS transporter [Candidatus Omnitrophota bacterium]